MKRKRKVILDDFEYRIMANALNELRNNLIREGRCTIDVDELLLRIIDAPIKRRNARQETKNMEKFITDERTGLRYELIGDIYYIAGDDEPEEEPIGIWGQQHLRYIREHRHSLYCELLMTGRLNSYLADIDHQAEDMLFRLVEEIAKSEGITEQFKAENQMEWVQRMNSIRQSAMEIVNNNLLYA